MKEQRKLAAIMFTDIVGYSALMSKDEKVALQILSKNRELQKSALGRFHGEFIKEIGDGTLSIFQSSWDAISCAIELQNTLNESSYFQLRIGIHQGDIIISEKDVFGDGVNIASRIQALCEPGGILISETVYHDIRNKAEIKADCLGEKFLKNIDEPVKIYAISAECYKKISEQQSSKEIQHRQSKGWLKTGHGALTRNRILGIAAVIILAMIITGGYFVFSKKQGVSPSDKEESALKENSRGWTNSIAVLPFTDLSPEKDQEYFCDGMAEELINVMTQISDLKVVARTSAFSFKGKELDVKDIGKKLNVKTILEGSVRKSGHQLRISAQLIDVNNGYHLWSQTYDRELKDVFAIQDEISSAIVTALKTKLLPENMNLPTKKQTKDTEAYELYLKGRFYWNMRGTADDVQKVIVYMNKAIEKDSSYALAYAGLASACVVFPEWSDLPPEEFILKARMAAEKALELDPALAEPHTVLGLIRHEYEYDWEGAETEYKRAIELNPGYPTTHQWYGEYLSDMGRVEEALNEMKQAQELDPLSPVININVAIILMQMHLYDQAKEYYDKLIDLYPDYPSSYAGLAGIYDIQGKYDEALAMYQRAGEVSKDDNAYLLDIGLLYIKTGRKGEALKILDRLLASSGQGYIVSCSIAAMYWGLGDKDKTFTWLIKAYQERDIGLLGIKTDWFWDNLRSDPRFIALLRKMGLEK